MLILRAGKIEKLDLDSGCTRIELPLKVYLQTSDHAVVLSHTPMFNANFLVVQTEERERGHITSSPDAVTSLHVLFAKQRC
jgi:hypothetical protein